MPGGRSLGCRTCKQRKIKCDETRPVCLQCQRSRRPCPGALAPFVYQPEMAKTEVSEQPVKPAKRALRWRPVMEVKSRSWYLAVEKTPSPADCLRFATCSLQMCSRNPPPCSYLARRLAYTLDVTVGTGNDLIVCGEWLPNLACRIGHSHTLDAAVETLLLSHHALIRPDSVDEQQCAHAYGRALRLLLSGLQQVKDEVSIEILCAGLALCTVEAMNGSDAEHTGWLSHSGGSAAMLRACGPRWFKSHFERSLLYHQAPQFIASALVTGGFCFLNTPEWMPVFHDECEYLGKWDELQAKLVPVYATLPALMREFKAHGAATKHADCLLERAWEFRRQLLGLDTMVDQVLSDPDAVTEVPSTSPGSTLRVCYRFSSALVIQGLLLYWRLIIIIDNLIQRLTTRMGISKEALKELQVTSMHAADQITMSAEQTCEPLPIISTLFSFSLPAAITAYSKSEFRPWKDRSEIQWLQELLQSGLAPMNVALRGIMVKYFQAVELPCSGLPVPASLEATEAIPVQTIVQA